jgi:hypothetical protein
VPVIFFRGVDRHFCWRQREKSAVLGQRPQTPTRRQLLRRRDQPADPCCAQLHAHQRS